MAKTLNEKLLGVGTELRGLARQFDALIEAMGMLEESSKGHARKAAKKRPVTRKAAPKRAAAKKTAKKTKTKVDAKRATSKKKNKTALETVLMYVKRTKKGLTTGDLMKKTGYDKKKVSNTIYKLKKQGKIVVAERGRYVKA